MKSTLIFFIFLPITVTSIAQTNYQHNSLTIFQNGLTYIEKSAEVEVPNKKTVLFPLPFSTTETTPIIMGSIRVQSPQNIIDELQYTRQNVGEKGKHYFDNINQFFDSNIGARLSLTTKQGKVEGRLINVIVETFPEKLFLESDTGFQIVPISEVTSVTVFDRPNPAIDQDKEGDWVYALQLAKDQKKQRLDISYVQKGMTWHPNYYIDFLTNNKAILKLEATIVNDVEDFENAAVNLAVGYPSFLFEDSQSPLTAPQIPKSSFNTTITAHGIRRESYSEKSLSMAPNDYADPYDPSAVPEDANQEDLYFFKKTKVSSKKGSRTMVPLFETTINYRDIFKVNLPNNLDYNGYWISQERGNNNVLHCIEFINETGFPFTTGSILFRKNNGSELQFLAQNQLNYTPAGASTSPQMTVSTDVTVTEKNTETHREELRNRYNELTYLVSVEGQIDITNYKPEAIDMEINKMVAGKLDKSSIKWTYNTKITQDNNPRNQVSWKLNLAGGKSASIVYNYQYLTR